jgi:hypothetical protein
VRNPRSDEPEAIHHAVSAGIMDALGRGFLIATAGIVVGAMVGTAQLAALGLWTLGIAAAAGVGLTIGSALVKHAGCKATEPETEAARQHGEIMAFVASLPVVIEGEAVTLSDQPMGYVALLESQRARERMTPGKSV